MRLNYPWSKSRQLQVGSILLLLLAATPRMARADTCVLDLDPKQTLSDSDRLSQVCDQLNAEIRARRAGSPEHPLVSVGDYIKQFLYYVAGPPSVLSSIPQDALKEGERLLEKARVDEQIGPTGPISGTTNLVARGGVPTLVGLALEAGALTQTVSGSTATFRANAGGLLNSLIGRDTSALLTTPSRHFSLQRLSLAASFDLSRAGTTNVPVSGTATTPAAGSPGSAQPVNAVTIPTSTRELSSFVARYQVTAPRDLASSKFAADWKKALEDKKAVFNNAQDDLFNAVKAVLDKSDPPEVRDWRQRFARDLGGAKHEDVPELTRRYLNELIGIYNHLVPNFMQKAVAGTQAYARYYANYENVVASLNEKPLLSLEYTYSRPLEQPDLHNVRLIYGWNPKGGQALISLNAAGTFYGSLVPNASKYGRARDVQVAFQVDRPLPLGPPGGSSPVLTIAAYYQYQVAAAVLQAPTGTVIAGTNIELPKEASVLLTPKGNMVIAQAKVTMRMKDTGVKIPIGVTWSNRSELIKANDVRGHIGLTYDFDSLLHH